MAFLILNSNPLSLTFFLEKNKLRKVKLLLDFFHVKESNEKSVRDS